MSFNKSRFYTLEDRTPAQLAGALASAFESANGTGHTFRVFGLSYNLPDGVSFNADDPRLSEVVELAAFPDSFSLHVAADDANVAYASVRLEQGRLAVSVAAAAAEGLATFFDAFSNSFGTRETISAIDEVVKGISALEESTRVNSPSKTTRRDEPDTGHKVSKRDAVATSRVLIFTALQEERDAFEQALGLKTAFEDNVARGVRHGIAIELISARRMGRVPAAVALATHLAKTPFRFQLIVVAGLAGGFTEASVHTGAVVIATEVVDLATRKLHEEGTEFRPHLYSTDNVVERFAKSSAFDKSKWAQALVERDKWPKGRRPYIEYGQLACTDEVVSSDEWRSQLLEAWPKLLGVEMESGGGCAAAEQFGHRVAVVRGVSDLADPRKSDDEWRRLSMGAVIGLIDELLSSGVIKPTDHP